LVIDASGAIDFHTKHDLSPQDSEYGVLVAKFLERLEAPDKKGNPQILSPDNKMQKAIGNGVHEIRMVDKNRMYFALAPGTKDNPETRIVLLGAHGGDEDTQDEFIQAVL